MPQFEVDPEAGEKHVADARKAEESKESEEKSSDEDTGSEEKDAEESNDDLTIEKPKESDDADAGDEGEGDDDKDDDADGEGDDEDDKDADKEAKKAVESVDLDFAALTTEFVDNNLDLTEESLAKVYAQMEAVKIPNEMVDDYLAGLRARINASREEAWDIAGGKEGYQAMAEWAGENLSPEELDAFNANVQATPAHAKLAIEGLHSRYLEAHGGTEKSLTPRSGSPSKGDAVPIESREALLTLMKDPRYQKDEGFRKQVQDKLRRSMESGRYSQTPLER